MPKVTLHSQVGQDIQWDAYPSGRRIRELHLKLFYLAGARANKPTQTQAHQQIQIQIQEKQKPGNRCLNNKINEIKTSQEKQNKCSQRNTHNTFFFSGCGMELTHLETRFHIRGHFPYFFCKHYLQPLFVLEKCTKFYIYYIVNANVATNL